jgi:hypothetical protein
MEMRSASASREREYKLTWISRRDAAFARQVPDDQTGTGGRAGDAIIDVDRNKAISALMIL